MDSLTIDVQNKEEKTLAPDFWDDTSAAEAYIRALQPKKQWLSDINQLTSKIDDLSVLIEFSKSGDNVTEELNALFAEATSFIEELEFKNMLSEEGDSFSAVLQITAGAGGTESCDWASMLSRMYVRWAERHNYKVELMAENAGDEAGIKSVTYKIQGLNAYGWLKSESGVHRLVRISPFDSNAKRHTSFASVWVYPVIDENIEIDVNPADIRIDTYRSSGAGGQHVNTTDSAVRITHHPTGIVVTSSEKSQHQNRDIAMKALKSRLYQLELDKRTSAISDAHESKGDAGWGNQIRSYVLQPYQMVKDLRSNIETSDTQGVLNGNLDMFMSGALAQKVTGKSRSEANSQN